MHLNDKSYILYKMTVYTTFSIKNLTTSTDLQTIGISTYINFTNTEISNVCYTNFASL